MASTTALYTGLSGLNANSRFLDVAGNNISNSNTTAFKSSRIAFETQFSRTLSAGRQPGGSFGGSNPTQIGLGVRVGGTQRDFTAGSISATGDARDMAIDGNGFFIVDQGGSQVYTRDGSFRPNENNVLTSVGGAVLMGFGIDDNFQLNTGTLSPIEIPLGTLTIAEPTTTVRVQGNLKADGALPTRGAEVYLTGSSNSGLPAQGFGTLAAATVPPAVGDRVSGAGLLVELEDPDNPGVAAFSAGQFIEIDGAETGDGARIGPELFEITPASTLDDLAAFIEGVFGIDTSTGPNPDGNTPGVTIDAATGRIRIDGNTGGVNDIVIEATDIGLVDASGNAVGSSPFVVDEVAGSDGESIRTSFTVFDSLGTPLTVDMTMVLDSRDSTGTTWRYYVSSPDDTDLSNALGTGTVRFDTSGRLLTDQPIDVLLDRPDTGAAGPLNFEIELTSDASSVTSLTDNDSQLGAVFRDGAPIGELSNFGIGEDGLIVGIFTNGLTRTIGQVPVASFANQEGLVEVGGNMYSVGPNTGEPVVSVAGQFGTGGIVSGALELSNVDLGAEFINLILASTGYNASSRVIQESDDLLQQLLLIGR